MTTIRDAVEAALAAAAAAEAAAAGAMPGGGGIVYYGATASTARPGTDSPVVWIGDTGTVPTHAEDNDIVITTAPPEPDANPPAVGTLTASNITDEGFTLTVTGASDAEALHATPYAFSTNGGTDWSAYQSSAVFVKTGLAASTGYSCRHRVRDASGNVSTGTAQTVNTLALPPVGNVTTFGSDTVSSPPAGWSTPWSAAGLSWEVAADGGATDGKVLKIGGTDTTRHAYIWDGSGADADADVEVLWKFKYGTIGSLRLLMHVSGSLASETGIYLIAGGGNVQGGGIIAGTIVSGGFGFVGVTLGTLSDWSYMRARIVGDQLSIRAWYGTNPEPGTWDGTLTIPSGLLAAGDVGFYNNVNDPLDYAVDWISVAVGGDTAANPEA